MKIEDHPRGTEIVLSESIDLDRQIELLATSDQGDTVWFYLNEEQARDVVRHLNRLFDLGLHI